MSTAARKARKRAGEKVAPKPVKVVTPIEQRAWFNATFPGVPGTRHSGLFSQRSLKKRTRALDARRVDAEAVSE